MSIQKEVNGIILLGMIVILCTGILMSIYSLNRLKQTEVESLRHTVMEERRNQLRDVVQNAWSVLRASRFYEPAQEAIGSMRFGDNSQNHFVVIDTQGMYWVNPARPDLVGKNIERLTDPEAKNNIQEIITRALVSEEGYFEMKGVQTDAASRLMHYKLYKPWGWVVCAGISVADIEQVLARNRSAIDAAMHRQVLLIGGVGILILAIMVFFSTRFIGSRIVKPIRELTDGVDRTVNGDFDVAFDIRSNREINQLVDAMVRMQNSMAVAYRRLRSRVDSPTPPESEDLKEVNRTLRSIRAAS